MPDAPPPRDYLSEIADALVANDAKSLAKIAMELHGMASRDEHRRAVEAERKRRSRHGMSRDVTGRPGQRSSSTPLDTRTERDYSDVSVTSRDVTGQALPPVDEAIQRKLDLLRGQMGDERFPAADAFIRRRPYRTWAGWLDEMLTTIGPVSQYTPADLERVCKDDAALDRPIGSPRGLRSFLVNARVERLKPQPAEAGPVPDSAGQYVNKIRGLVKQIPGRNKYLPKSEVEALGPDVLRAYEAVGGADRFLSLDGKDLPFLIRDFNNAMRGAA